ncbi:MAG: hypothetical protein B6I31_02295 [Desulfobacteraceae bacterium 4572_19]|nr:MAG: hypothetical protein B6I31_02295 [Desulfobacteraceae bacterium 4572_19]
MHHTSRKEEVKIKLGNAFDLKGERKVKNQQKISKNSTRQTIEIELKNNKPKEDVNITVEESLSCTDWEIESSNYKYIKKDIYNIEFTIPVKAEGKTVLKYTVLCSW